MSEPLRIGVLGAARISETSLVAPALATGHRLVAVAARDSGRAHEFAEQHGVERVVGSYADLLADPEVELVYNPLVNSLHGPLNLAALRAGKHVLSEKPSASNAAEARHVREVAAGSAGVFVEAFHYLFHPVFGRVVELVADGAVGRVLRTEVSLTMPPPDDDDPRWRLALAGGSAMDLGCYSLHASRMLGRLLGGEPEVVGSVAVERAGQPGVDESLRVDLGYPDGTTGTAYSDMGGSECRGLRLPPPRRRDRRRRVRAGLRAAPPGRLGRGHHERRVADRAPRDAVVVHLPAGGRG